MNLTLTQIAPLIANAGFTQNVNITTPNNPAVALTSALASSLNPTTATPATASGTSNLAYWIFGGALLFWLFNID